MGKKISELNKLASITGTELIPVVSNGSNYTVTVDDIKKDLVTSNEISNKADKATTLSGYGITDAKIEDNTITLGNKTITPITSLVEYSKTKDIEGMISAAKSEILGGAGEDYDTLKEIETWVSDHEDLYEGLLSTIGEKAASSDLTSHIEDTEKHIQEDERETWNAKQDAISDLGTIRENASTAKSWGNHSEAGYLTKSEAETTYQTILPTGVNTVDSVASIPTTKTMCVVNATAGGSFGLSGTLAAGQEVHVVINNTGSSKITISIPTTFKASVDSLEIESSKFGEINVISDGTNNYLRAV